jgi:hypothetical protein
VRSRTQIVAWVLGGRVAVGSDTAAPEIRYARSSGVDIAYQVFGTASPDLLALSSALIPIDSVADEPRLGLFHERLASFSRVMRFDIRLRGGGRPSDHNACRDQGGQCHDQHRPDDPGPCNSSSGAIDR